MFERDSGGVKVKVGQIIITLNQCDTQILLAEVTTRAKQQTVTKHNNTQFTKKLNYAGLVIGESHGIYPLSPHVLKLPNLI
jgi:hypothetical protein